MFLFFVPFMKRVRWVRFLNCFFIYSDNVGYKSNMLVLCNSKNPTHRKTKEIVIIIWLILLSFEPVVGIPFFTTVIYKQLMLLFYKVIGIDK